MIRVIGNTVGDLLLGRSIVFASDTSNVALVDQSKVANLRGGNRHLECNLATAGTRFVYLDLSGGLEADCFVVVNADRHNTKSVAIRAWTTYTGSSSDLFSSGSFAETLIGPSGKDWAYIHSSVSTGKQAFSLNLDTGSYAKKVNQFYAGKAVVFPEESATFAFTQFFRSKLEDPPVLFHGNRFHLWGRTSLVLGGVTRSLYNEFLALNLKEPVFVHDDSGTSTVGNVIEHKMLHAIVMSHALDTPGADNLFNLSLQLGILRHWR